MVDRPIAGIFVRPNEDLAVVRKKRGVVLDGHAPTVFENDVAVASATAGHLQIRTGNSQLVGSV